ncbi:MAG: adenine deaminase [Blautia sp.]|nr:adenine deaminase [Blautia sp.]
MKKKQLKRLIDVASGRVPADLHIKNCRVVDVFNKEVFESDVYIAESCFAGFGDESFPEAHVTVDAGGRYMVPGFIDGHVHIESSHVTPPEFARLVVPHGTTTAVADPHEIVNVCGLDGFDYMLESSEGLALTVFLQVPSCVPCTPFENSGAIINSVAIGTRIAKPRVIGLGEMMDFTGVCSGDESILKKLLMAKKYHRIIDGHYLGDVKGLDAYIAAGISNDHECAHGNDLKERVRRGMRVFLRQGTACHDLLNLLSGVNERNKSRVMMCTDDCAAKTIIEIGHIDNNVRLAIGAGINPIDAICMATINTAECFRLDDRGAIAPGRRADFLLLSSLDKDFRVEEVYTGGEHTASGGSFLPEKLHVPTARVSGTVNIGSFTEDRLKLHLRDPHVRVIDLVPGSVVTREFDTIVETDDEGYWHRNDEDIIKIAVIERHHGTGNTGLGLVRGFHLQGGAIATTIAHDSHNIIVAGDNDHDMSVAVHTLAEIGGGMTVVKNGQVLESVPHEIAGLMGDHRGEDMAARLTSIIATAKEALGIHSIPDPFMTLCFMSLPVIPKLKVTDMGLFDVDIFNFVPVEKI